MALEQPLPRGWVWSEIQSVLDAPVVYGILQPGPDVFDGIPYVRPTEIGPEGIEVEKLRRTTRKIAAEYERSSLKAGDVLMSIVGTIGKVAIVPKELDGANITQSSARLRPALEVLDRQFLAKALRSPLVKAQVEQLVLGSGVPRLNIAHVRKLKLPLPPIAEQRRIVAKLEALLERIRRAKDPLDAIRLMLERQRQSILAAAFRGDFTVDWRAAHPNVEPAWKLLDRIRFEAKLEEPVVIDNSLLPALADGWAWTSLGEIKAAEPNAMTDGPFGSNLKSADYTSAGVRVVRLGNIGVGRFLDDDKAFISSSKFAELKKHEVFGGDLVIAALGDPVGRCCEVPAALGPAIVKADCVRIKVRPAFVAKFVMHWLNSPAGRTVSAAAGHGLGRLRINLGDMRSLPVPVASMEEQQQLVEAIDAHLRRIAAVEEAVASSLAQLDSLDAAALAKAFCGELVPQDPSDEPAAILLERIRNERQAAPPVGGHETSRANAPGPSRGRRRSP